MRRLLNQWHRSQGPNSRNSTVKTRTLYSLFLLCLAFLPAGKAPAAALEAGAYFMGQFGPKVYGMSPQNWAAVQDRRGVMFFGNTDGVLEFDGATWRQVSFDGLPAMSLAFDSKGTLFVGSENDFGYLEPDPEGGDFNFVSLAKQLSPSARHFGNVRTIACLNETVVFTASNNLYAWNTETKKLSTISAPGASRSLVLDDSIYVLLRPFGLKRLEGSKLVNVFNQDLLPHKLLRSISHFHGTFILATAGELYREDKGRITRWKTEAAPLLSEAGVVTLLPLRNGMLAIATARSGVFLVDENGKLDHVVDKHAGLRSDAVSALFEDRQNGLWLALDRGLARVEVESPLTNYGETENIGEMVTSVTRFNGVIYAGTAVGLSYLLPGLNGALPTFQPVPGTPDHVVTLLPRKDDLLTGGNGGIFRVAEGRSESVLKTAVIYDLAPSSDGRRVYAVGSGGLYLLAKENTQWKLLSSLDGPEWRTVVEDSPQSVWVTGRTSISHVDVSRPSPLAETFGRTEGVPTGWVNAYKVAGRIVFATSSGIRRFNPQTRTFIPDPFFGADFAADSEKVSLLRDGKDGQVWLSGDGYQTLLIRRPDGAYLRRDEPLARAGIHELYSLYVESDGTVWASGMDGGLVRSSPSRLEVPPTPALLLRRIQSLKSKENIAEALPNANAPRIHYRDNALRFEFALPDFEDTSRTEYQVWLKGLDRDWSAWSPEAEKEYTNLYEKEYTLLARARNLNGTVSAPIQFEFRVLPPWYRTWWSFILYAAILAAAIAFIIRLRLRQLAAQNRKLELMVTTRTARIREQRDQIVEKERETTSLLLNILPPQVADELRTTGKVDPVSCQNVAVCFTDFVGFTRACESMTAQELVTALHAYFGAFDDVINRYNLEKLKTIGDSYMFVGGVPRSRNAATLDTVLAALELTRTVERIGETSGDLSWKIRVGVHCGPAVAGIVGSKKFAFDIWGETVNLASRMETSSQPNTVNVSAAAYEVIKDFIDCESRGLVRTKEGRHLEMYFARQLKPELLAHPDRFHALYQERFLESPPPVDFQVHSTALAQ